MSKKPHCFVGRNWWKILKGLELLLGRIKKFNEISRSFGPEILEINFSHMGLYKAGLVSAGKGTENAEKY
jgi:hypothetical protein